MRLINYLLALVLIVSATAPVYASLAYNEADSGDLSNTGLSPTLVVVVQGANQIFGTTGRGTNGIDRDYFTISIAPDYKLTSIVLLSGTSIGGNSSFIGVEAGNQVTLATNTQSAAGLLGWWQYKSDDINTDLLSKMSVASNGSSGFTPPLGGGEYAFWVQEFSPGQFNYGLELNISQIPLPSAYLAFLSGLGLLSKLSRKSRIR
jgi:hypothetical protein